MVSPAVPAARRRPSTVTVGAAADPGTAVRQTRHRARPETHSAPAQAAATSTATMAGTQMPYVYLTSTSRHAYTLLPRGHTELVTTRHSLGHIHHDTAYTRAYTLGAHTRAYPRAYTRAHTEGIPSGIHTRAHTQSSHARAQTRTHLLRVGVAREVAQPRAGEQPCEACGARTCDKEPRRPTEATAARAPPRGADVVERRAARA
jgi:hypothetical protein